MKKRSSEHAYTLDTAVNTLLIFALGFPGGTVMKNPPANAGDLGSGSISESGRSPGETNSYPCQYSCLDISIDRGTWRATVHVVAKS